MNKPQIQVLLALRVILDDPEIGIQLKVEWFRSGYDQMLRRMVDEFNEEFEAGQRRRHVQALDRINAEHQRELARLMHDGWI